jgi:hypothetical protein
MSTKEERWLPVLQREIEEEDYPEILRTLGILTFNREHDVRIEIPVEVYAILVLGGKLTQHKWGQIGLPVNWSMVVPVDSSKNVFNAAEQHS